MDTPPLKAVEANGQIIINPKPEFFVSPLSWPPISSPRRPHIYTWPEISNVCAKNGSWHFPAIHVLRAGVINRRNEICFLGEFWLN